MSTRAWSRPVLLVVASLAIASGTACAADVPQHVITGVGHAAGAGGLLGRLIECGGGVDGGVGGAGGAPAEPGASGGPGLAGCLPLGELPDKAGHDLSVVDKVHVVLIVLSGDTTVADVAEKYRVPESEVETWQRQFLGGDWPALIRADVLPPS
ncbi:hypothetical protein ACFXOS_07665 [Streptomyces sp. NPDC059175]|uniref:hypothetical protein n=1 Tax=Streptomyces sp. NPDC059175 TaxID=3346757 RepID=UPI00369BAFF0